MWVHIHATAYVRVARGRGREAWCMCLRMMRLCVGDLCASSACVRALETVHTHDAIACARYVRTLVIGAFLSRHGEGVSG